MSFLNFALMCCGLASFCALAVPFPPFKGRGVALLTLLGSIIILGAINKSNVNSLDSDEVTGTQSPAIERNQNIDQSRDGNSSIAQSSISDADVAGILSDSRESKWVDAMGKFEKLNRNAANYQEVVEKIERAVLEIVRPIPSSDIERNLGGYQFLTHIDPTSEIYSTKESSYKSMKDDLERSIISSLVKKVDKVENVTWYSHRNNPKYTNSRSTVHVYIGEQKTGYTWLRMRIQYAASDWLFVKRVHVWYDGTKVLFATGRFERDNNSTIWEWQDVSPDPLQIQVLKKISAAKEVILRFEGSQYHRDVKISNADKKAIRDVLTAFEVMQRR